MNLRILFLILIAAFILTLVTSQAKYYDDFQGISTTPDAYDFTQGFPFVINRVAAPSVVLTSSESINPYKAIFYSYLFWVTGIAALIFLKRESQKRLKLNLILAFVCGLILMQVYISSETSCMQGYPIKFLSICGGLSPNNPVWFFVILDLIFWIIIGIIVMALIRVSDKLPKVSKFKLSPFFMPLILTIVSFVSYNSCSGFICLGSSGRGYPSNYWIESYPPRFDLIGFLIDYIFWFISYLIIRGIRKLLVVIRNSIKNK